MRHMIRSRDVEIFFKVGIAIADVAKQLTEISSYQSSPGKYYQCAIDNVTDFF